MLEPVAASVGEKQGSVSFIVVVDDSASLALQHE